ncbi:hypothetical protein DOY81_013925, partial [Sarcophaga bullata]
MENFKKILIINVGLLIMQHTDAANSIDNLVQKANIYYQQPLKEGQAHEFTLETIQELPTKTDIKVIVHGFLGNRFHTSIIPLRNG